MSASSHSPRTTARHEPGREVPEPQMITMTPLNFVTFLLSLALVDIRMSISRRQNHSDQSRLPAWLHVLVYRYQPYGGTDGYYHTKQKKLMRMEADEAFKMRNTMVLLIVTGTLALLFGGICATRIAYQHLIAH